MPEDTNALIEKLARDARPVKPLAPPLVRAAVFVAAVLAAMGAFALYAGRVSEAFTHLSEMPFAIELAGALIAGIGAIVAAVMMSVPGRSESWIYLPLPGILLWLIGGAIECYGDVEAVGLTARSLFASRDCFIFIVAAGLPTAGAAYLLLRRAVSIHLLPVMALAGLGAAMLAAVLLQFVHAHGANPVDFATHAVAIAVIMFVMMTAGRIGFKRG
jgi:hypothetical protein